MLTRNQPSFISALPLSNTRRIRSVKPLTSSPKMATARTAVVQIGTGTDLHGQDATTAAVRACRNAIQYNSLPGLTRLVTTGKFADLQVDVKLGVPEAFMTDINIEKVKAQFPYGKVSIGVEQGGLLCSSGVILPEQGDHESDDRVVVVVAAVSVLC